MVSALPHVTLPHTYTANPATHSVVVCLSCRPAWSWRGSKAVLTTEPKRANKSWQVILKGRWRYYGLQAPFKIMIRKEKENCILTGVLVDHSKRYRILRRKFQSGSSLLCWRNFDNLAIPERTHLHQGEACVLGITLVLLNFRVLKVKLSKGSSLWRIIAAPWPSRV